MMGLRTTGLAALAALVLAGCSTPLSLNDTPGAATGATGKTDGAPVESRTPNAVSANVLSGGQPAAAPLSQVATVSLPPSGVSSPVAASAGAAGAAAANLGRLVYFDFDSFVVTDQFRGLVESHAKLLAASRNKRVVVEGHTDERGGREYNLALGQKRAEAVAKSLALLGASEAQIEAVSFGKERPASEAHDEAAWAQNRRAEIKDR